MTAMDNNGQLTFSDDPVLNQVNESYQLIEKGDFSTALDKINELLDLDPNYPGLIDGYRTAKFWLNRSKDLQNLGDGMEKAEFLMKQWEIFNEYAQSKGMTSSTAFNAIMRHIFFKASDHYRIAFTEQQDTTHDFSFLLNLGICFLRLEEYKSVVDTLEYAKNSYKSNARLLAILGEAYYHLEDIPKSLLYFREAFFADPNEIDLDIIRAKPILEIVGVVQQERSGVPDIREWIPVYGFIHDVFYVRRNLDKHQVDSIQREIYGLERKYQKMSSDQLEESNILPRLVNKYLWLIDYYEFQNYNYDNLSQIRDRLMKLDKSLFKPYFEKKKF